MQSLSKLFVYMCVYMFLCLSMFAFCIDTTQSVAVYAHFIAINEICCVFICAFYTVCLLVFACLRPSLMHNALPYNAYTFLLLQHKGQIGACIDICLVTFCLYIGIFCVYQGDPCNIELSAHFACVMLFLYI